jgi:CelD/BcsL family acetyltransferase involved in cellulose biosynthesis
MEEAGCRVKACSQSDSEIGSRGTMDSVMHSKPAGMTTYKVEDAERTSPQFLAEWEQLLSQSNSLYCQYSSPEWVETAIQSGFSSYSLQAARDSAGALFALLVWREREITLVAGPRSMGLWVNRPALCVEGDVLMRRPLHADAVRMLVAMFPANRIVQIKCLATDHPAWDMLNNAKALSPHHLRWTSSPAQPLLFRVLEPGSEGFKLDLSQRRKRHLRQGARALSKLASASLTIDRIDAPDQVDSFCTAAADIIGKSWQRRIPIAQAYAALQNEQFLKKLAERGLLRSYVLRAGDHTCAFVLGYQYRGIFHYSDVAYDEDLAYASPGILLLQFLVQDLASWNPPRMVNFGIGEDIYKRIFCNSQIASGSICFLPKSPANRILLMLGKMFDAVRRAKQKIAGSPGESAFPKDERDSRPDLRADALRE